MRGEGAGEVGFVGEEDVVDCLIGVSSTDEDVGMGGIDKRREGDVPLSFAVIGRYLEVPRKDAR